MTENRERVQRSPRGHRQDVQGLRALSVALVVAFHLWPFQISGGFIGVDVFFVISGFLITGHLIRDAEKFGTPRLGEFWARRVRRLLPASMTVLVAVFIGTVAWVPQSDWTQFFGELAAAALYSENWKMAFDAVDYLAATNEPSPVQHYWSLGVEEQFYLAWPILVSLAYWSRVARIFRDNSKTALVALLTLISFGSLLVSVQLTSSSPAIAYVGTHARAWEFAIGGLVACLPVLRLKQFFSTLLFLFGISLVVIAALIFDESTAFPGYTAALPVVGASICLYQVGKHASWLRKLYSLRPVQLVGDLSYGIYLWHWPLIILGPYLLGHSLTQVERIGVVVVTLVLSFVTKAIVEDPLRFRLPAKWAGPGVIFGSAIACSTILVAVSAAVVAPIARLEASLGDEAIAKPANDCLGAAALNSQQPCVPDDGPIVPDPRIAKKDRAEIYNDACRTSPVESDVKQCREGQGGVPRVALIGDSHAAQWYPAVAPVVRKVGGELTVYFKAACPFSEETSRWSGPDKRTSCSQWNASVLERLRAERYDIVITSAVTTHDYEGNGVEGFVDRWQSLQGLGSRVIAIADSPRMSRAVLNCIVDESGDASKCGLSAAAAVPFDPLRVAAARTHDVQLLDVVPLLCPRGWCPAVIGNVVVYRDTSSHLTATFVKTLRPFFESQLAL